VITFCAMLGVVSSKTTMSGLPRDWAPCAPALLLYHNVRTRC